MYTADRYLSLFIADAISAFPFQGTDFFQKIDHSVYCRHSNIWIFFRCQKIYFLTTGTFFLQNNIQYDLSLFCNPAAFPAKSVNNSTPLHAASLGLPFLPVRLMQGSGLTKYWGISKEQRAEMPSMDNDKYVMVDNPFNPGEQVVAVPVPKLDTAIIHVQKASPDGTCIIEGDEFHDVDVAVAAKKVIVTCEELVSDEYIRRDPTLTRVFGECVSAVVHAPYGAWPSQCYNYYDCDGNALKEYDKASKYQDAEDAKVQLAKAAAKAAKTAAAKPDDAKAAEAAQKAAAAAKAAEEGTAIPETFKDYLDKWVYGVKDNDELLNVIGGARLAGLKVVPGLGYAGKI